jgi:hypothetical protein
MNMPEPATRHPLNEHDDVLNVTVAHLKKSLPAAVDFAVLLGVDGPESYRSAVEQRSSLHGMLGMSLTILQETMASVQRHRAHCRCEESALIQRAVATAIAAIGDTDAAPKATQ